MDVMRRCSKCGTMYPATSEFFKLNKRVSSGLSSWCRPCARESNRLYAQNNPDKERAKKDKHRQKYPERYRESQKRYYDANPEKCQASSRRYWEQNPEKVKGIVRNWQSKNGEKLRVIKQRRVARMNNQPYELTAAEWDKALNYWKGCCAYCSQLLEQVTLDHYIPVSAKNCPGTIVTNVLPACVYCNTSKNDTAVNIWLVTRFGNDLAEKIDMEIQKYFQFVIKGEQNDE